MMKIVIFGTGEAGRQAYIWFSKRSDVEILGFADNDQRKHGSRFCGARIYAPTVLPCMGEVHVVIASMYYKEIRDQLLAQLAIPAPRILYSLDTFMLKAADLCRQWDTAGVEKLASAAGLQYGCTAKRLIYAKQAESWKDWERSIELLQSAQAEENVKCSGFALQISLALANTYILCANYALAESTIEEALVHDPDHWTLLKLYAEVAMFQQSWSVAAKRWSRLLSARGTDHIPAGICCSLARCYRECGETGKETKIVRRAIESLCQPSELDAIIGRIRMTLPVGNAQINSRCSLLEEGENVLGAIFHECEMGTRRRYVTKVVDHLHVGAESCVYQHLLPEHPSLQRHAPIFINHDETANGRIHFITLEWFEGRPCTMTDIGAILDVVPDILGIPVDQAGILNSSPTLIRQRSVQNISHIGIATLCSHLHEEEPNHILLDMLEQCAKTCELPPQVMTHIETVRRIILRDRLYAHVDPRRYCLFHGDLRKENILIGADGNVCVLDWAYVSTGFKGYDLALLFSSFDLSWGEICDLLRTRFAILQRMNLIDYLLFLYVLVCFWIPFLRPCRGGRQFNPPPTFVEDIGAIVRLIERIHAQQEAWHSPMDLNELA